MEIPSGFAVILREYLMLKKLMSATALGVVLSAGAGMTAHGQVTPNLALLKPKIEEGRLWRERGGLFYTRLINPSGDGSNERDADVACPTCLHLAHLEDGQLGLRSGQLVSRYRSH